MSKILFEPFRIKSVEAITFSTEGERSKWIQEAGYNLFNLSSDQILIDLLTDSGTGAMSDKQWAEMIKADESYAGSRSFFDLESAAKDIFGMEFVLPVHQGRAAEHLFFSTVLKKGDIVPSNSHFDTTLANIEAAGATGVNLLCLEGQDPFAYAPFKGNIDIAKLESLLRSDGEKIPLVIMTITNNTAGGQPVSLSNIAQAAEIAHRHKKLFVIDACRFAENSYFIKKREEKFQDVSPIDIAREIFSHADVVTFSGKKDALSNIGGLLCLRDEKLVNKLKTCLIVTEGFPTYGGLAGYSMAAMAQGLKEVLDEKYLEYRLRTVEWMVEKLERADIPVVVPAGGHAVYIDSARLYPHIKRDELPGISLCVALYVKGGIRSCELGTVAFGKRDINGKLISPPLELVRLAIPRRMYTEAHMGYVVECLLEISTVRDSARGYRFVEEFEILRHFRSTFAPL